jgi:fructose-1,6-bisphosphatase I
MSLMEPTDTGAITTAIADTAREIRGGLLSRRGKAEGTNPSGETQLAADVWADDRFADALTDLPAVGTYASEEREAALDCGAGLSVAVDPLDGSSNLPTNNACGTLFGVYDAELPATGRELLAAGYVLYGPTTTMVVATEGTVSEHVITDDGIETVDESVSIPEEPVVYGFGGRRPDWTDGFADYAQGVEHERKLKARYGGALVGDVNQVLGHGGVFAYPALRDAPDGKLRLQFEGNPVAYVVECAGGASSDGTGSILECEPDTLHDRVPFHVGNEALIEELEAEVSR